MTRIFALITVLAISLSFTAVMAGDEAKAVMAEKAEKAEKIDKADLVSYTGWFTDSHCLANNANTEGKNCAIDCWKKMGASLVLYVPETKKTIKLNDEEKASKHVGVEVKVTGMMDGETLKIAKIEEVKKAKKG